MQPRPARTFELASLSGSESVGVTRLLMSLDDPSPAVIRAVDAAVAWFASAKMTGLWQDYRDDPQAPGGRDKIVVPDPQAGPLWARFYDLKTNQPIFADRDGVPRQHLADIGYERRNGYAWLGDWPQRLIEVEYPRWIKAVSCRTLKGGHLRLRECDAGGRNTLPRADSPAMLTELDTRYRVCRGPRLSHPSSHCFGVSLMHVSRAALALLLLLVIVLAPLSARAAKQGSIGNRVEEFALRDFHGNRRAR